MPQLKHTQSLEVADLVTNGGMKLADAVHQVLGAIKDGSGPRTSEVADEAREIIASRPVEAGQEGQPFAEDLFATWADFEEVAVLAITDNGGKTHDRYTAVFRDGDILGFSDSPGHPLGFSQWCGENGSAADVEEWIANGETLVTDPPEWMRRHLMARMNEAYRDGVVSALAKGRPIEEIRDELYGDLFLSAKYEPAASPTP